VPNCIVKNLKGKPGFKAIKGCVTLFPRGNATGHLIKLACKSPCLEGKKKNASSGLGHGSIISGLALQVFHFRSQDVPRTARA
jgi:hypothetical protein